MEKEESRNNGKGEQKKWGNWRRKGDVEMWTTSRGEDKTDEGILKDEHDKRRCQTKTFTSRCHAHYHLLSG